MDAVKFVVAHPNINKALQHKFGFGVTFVKSASDNFQADNHQS